MRDWIKEYRDYHETMQWHDDCEVDHDNITQETARDMLKNDIEFIIGTNGWGELYDSELELAKELNIEEG